MQLLHAATLLVSNSIALGLACQRVFAPLQNAWISLDGWSFLEANYRDMPRVAVRHKHGSPPRHTCTVPVFLNRPAVGRGIMGRAVGSVMYLEWEQWLERYAQSQLTVNVFRE